MFSRISRQSIQKSFIFLQTRQIHAKPKEYSGVNDIVYHFKKQDHFSYFLNYMMWTVFGSVALHLTWRKIEYREYKERTAHKINVLKEITHCLENKEEIKQSLRNEIKSVIRNEHAEEDEEGVLVKLLQSTEPEPTPEKIKDTSEGKWFEQKKVYL